MFISRRSTIPRLDVSSLDYTERSSVRLMRLEISLQVTVSLGYTLPNGIIVHYSLHEGNKPAVAFMFRSDPLYSLILLPTVRLINSIVALPFLAIDSFLEVGGDQSLPS